MKIRLLIAGGALAAAAVVPFAAHADPGPNSGTCSAPTAAASPSGTTQGLPDGGTVWADQGAQTAGITGSHGNLTAQSTGAQSGQVSGAQTESGLNGFATTDGGVCVGVAGTGGVNS
ncbi:MAG: hypothetical protein QOG03_61 [Actinomycetota bacterium]|jgi:hypothetical protein|nr:hypothetical protein [Actinomycetota bacterium]